MRKLRWPSLDRVLGLPRRSSGPPGIIIVGLGNPGAQYARTRHNVGFWCVDRLAAEHSIGFSRRHRSAHVGEGVVEGHRVVLAKPRTFVNRSGEAVAYLLQRFGVSPEKLLVVYDDVDLPLGKVRLRAKGSAGGHNGIKSIVESLGTQDFPRMRIGIGRPPDGADQVEYVTGTMSKDEQEVVDEAVRRAAQAAVDAVADGMTTAMNRFN